MRKKLILLISVLFCVSTYSQSRLDYTTTNAVTMVGDTLVVSFKYIKGNNQNDGYLSQFDFEYNNKLLSYIDSDWGLQSNPNAQRARNSWNGYKFNFDQTKDLTDFDGQYISWLSGSSTYQTSLDWTVDRVTIQDANPFVSDNNFITYYFKLKDKSNSNYNNYDNLIKMNWVNYKDIDGVQIDVTGQENIGLDNIQGGDAGTVTLNLFSNIISQNISVGSDYSYTIRLNGNSEQPLMSGVFDDSGQATVVGLENDVEYYVNISLSPTSEYLSDVVTVSDLALVFTESIGAGSSPDEQTSTFDYKIQSLLSDVNGDGNVDFSDSYLILAYLQGITTDYKFISRESSVFNISGLKDTFGEINSEGVVTFNDVIKPTDNNKSFDFAHALSGDVNFSHSFEPTSTNSTSFNKSNVRSNKSVGSKFNYSNSNIDLVSEIINNEVIFSINSQITGMVGSQFNIEYDRSRLTLKEVIFNTGNEMTNFSNHIENEGKVNVGSFDINFTSTIMTGTPYKLVFTPKTTIQNTSGLISFRVKEGVKTDGTPINFIIE